MTWNYILYGVYSVVLQSTSYISLQELRQLEQMQKTSQATRRDTSFSLKAGGTTDDSKLKSEYVVLERKYERLAQKEKRLQVQLPLNELQVQYNLELWKYF